MQGANRPLCPHGPVRSRLSLARGSSPSWGLGLHPRWGCVGCDEARERGADRQRRQDITISALGRKNRPQDVCLQDHRGRTESAGRSQLPRKPAQQPSQKHPGAPGSQEGDWKSLPPLPFPGTPKRPQQPQSSAKLSGFHVPPPQMPEPERTREKAFPQGDAQGQQMNWQLPVNHSGTSLSSPGNRMHSPHAGTGTLNTEGSVGRHAQNKTKSQTHRRSPHRPTHPTAPQPQPRGPGRGEGKGGHGSAHPGEENEVRTSLRRAGHTLAPHQTLLGLAFVFGQRHTSVSLEKGTGPAD